MPGAKNARTVMAIVAVIVIIGMVAAFMLGPATIAPR